MNTIRTTARRHRSFVNIGFATVAIVASVTMTAACGTDTTSPTPPANAPVEARIYPPTDVPEVRPDSTLPMLPNVAWRRTGENAPRGRPPQHAVSRQQKEGPAT